MRYQSRPIFVLDAREEASFAFEADSLSRAQEIARTPWLVRAVSPFRTSNRETSPLQPQLRPRAASESEAAAYRRFADEFASERNDLLLVRLNAV